MIWCGGLPLFGHVPAVTPFSILIVSKNGPELPLLLTRLRRRIRDLIGAVQAVNQCSSLHPRRSDIFAFVGRGQILLQICT